MCNELMHIPYSVFLYKKILCFCKLSNSPLKGEMNSQNELLTKQLLTFWASWYNKILIFFSSYKYFFANQIFLIKMLTT